MALSRLALITDQNTRSLVASDQQLLAPFLSHGVTASAAAWNDPAVDWTIFDMLIIRSRAI